MASEIALVEGCSAGSREAFCQLYCTYAPMLRHAIQRYTLAADDTEDILHDTFVTIIGAFDRFSYRGEGSLSAWLRRIAINETLMWLRQRKHFERLFTPTDRLPEMLDEEPDPSEIDGIPPDVLQRFIDELPTGYRTVLNLYIFEQRSHNEIGEALGINAKSSASQLTRAKKMLAHKIDQFIKSNEK